MVKRVSVVLWKCQFSLRVRVKEGVGVTVGGAVDPAPGVVLALEVEVVRTGGVAPPHPNNIIIRKVQATERQRLNMDSSASPTITMV